MYQFEKVVEDIEVLTILGEECAEVIQAASKCMRYGYDSEWEGKTAQDALQKELGDLLCMVDILADKSLISVEKLEQYAAEKREKLKKWSNLTLK